MGVQELLNKGVSSFQGLHQVNRYALAFANPRKIGVYICDFANVGQLLPVAVHYAFMLAERNYLGNLNRHCFIEEQTPRLF